MSLARTALRLAVIEALAPHGLLASDGPWPTIAGSRFFDSLTAPLDLTTLEDRVPVVGVFVDDQTTEGYGSATEVFGHARQQVKLAFELVVPFVEEGEIGLGLTDAGLEARLDLLQYQILARLQAALYSNPLAAVLLSIGKITSSPWRDPDTQERLSSRRVELDAHIRNDGPVPSSGTGLDRLPTPLLQVAQALPSQSAAAAICAALASLLAPEPALPDLEGIAVTATLDPFLTPSPDPVLPTVTVTID